MKYFKVFLLAALLACSSVAYEQQEDDGQYYPEIYEKPYEGYELYDEVSNNQPEYRPQQEIQQTSSSLHPVPYKHPAHVHAYQHPAPVPTVGYGTTTPPVYHQPGHFAPYEHPVPIGYQHHPLPAQTYVQSPPVYAYQQHSQSLPVYHSQPQAYRQPLPFHVKPVQPAVVLQTPVAYTNYQIDDGQKRLETVDNQGNIKGEYSYVDPNGKIIKVKYFAGKHGFQVEGDNLPQPVAPPAEKQPQETPDEEAEKQPQETPDEEAEKQPQETPDKEAEKQPQETPDKEAEKQPQETPAKESKKQPQETPKQEEQPEKEEPEQEATPGPEEPEPETTTAQEEEPQTEATPDQKARPKPKVTPVQKAKPLPLFTPHLKEYQVHQPLYAPHAVAPSLQGFDSLPPHLQYVSLLKQHKSQLYNQPQFVYRPLPHNIPFAAK